MTQLSFPLRTSVAVPLEWKSPVSLLPTTVPLKSLLPSPTSAVAVATTVVAAEAGISAIDTVWSALDDQEGFEAEVRNARALGFSGKSCIHPSQVPVVHRLYTPDEEEVAHARRVMEAMRAAEQAGAGVFTVDGKMVDAPVIAKARRVLLQIGEGV